jgi:2-succinyl-5-enolpyruvyl-6-hydroxy-3-cyclohexene-1-carboxylate synthase
MKNMELARRVIEELVFAGVREFCLCAGARNSPLVYLLEQSKDLTVYNFFEERSAAFFALGRIVSTDRPVAVITTSGTAVAELIPAAIEATYASIPLILISADRPKSYRGSGAPQTIEQVGMFSYYIEATFDLDEENTHISLKSLTYKKPIHINICFKEPLLDMPVEPVPVLEKTYPQRFPESADMKERQEVRAFLKKQTPLVVLGYLPPQFKNIVKNFLMRLSLPIYAETISGLRNDPDLAHLILKSGEAFVPKLFEKKYFDSVFRIGGVPTLRFWRDLEDKYIDTPVLSLSYNYYTGLSREVIHYADMHFLDYIHDTADKNFDEVMNLLDLFNLSNFGC